MTLLITKEISERTVKFVGSQSHAGHGKYEDRNSGCRMVLCWGKKCMGDGLYAQTCLPGGRILVEGNGGTAKVER